MNFSTLQGLTIPEGVVTQIAKDGVVLWKLETSKPIILEVEKITSDTYAGETAYTGEQFILLDIYPKTNGTVNVTYGGLTKTITDTSGATEPNAQKVFFGTFNGVSDSVATPTSGTLTIEGDCVAFGCSYYVKNNKAQGSYSACIVEIVDWGDVKKIANSAFRDCTKLALASLPSNITSIGDYAFYNSGLHIVILPKLKVVSSFMFDGSKRLESVDLREATQIKGSAFSYCRDLATLIIRTNSVCSLAYATAFNDSAIKNGTGYIYVPAALVDSYKTATNWSTYAAQFRAIEDYPEICGG
jgi:hypothetical protein